MAEKFSHVTLRGRELDALVNKSDLDEHAYPYPTGNDHLSAAYWKFRSALALRVECPLCHMPPGSPCHRRMSEAVLQKPHADRVTAATKDVRKGALAAKEEN